jgi:FkbM family methyltransferase
VTGRRPLKCLIASNVYGSYCVPVSSKHRPAAAAILRGDIWEPETLAFLCANCGRDDIIHAGTYFGDFLPALSKAAGPLAQIWAFEPSGETFRCAANTLKLNDISNVRLTNAGLGAGPGRASLRTGETGGRAAGGGSEIVTEKLPGFDHEEVHLVAIDDVVPHDRKIGVLQLDVEKYEQQALTGALATIRRCRPVLVLETLPADRLWFAENILSLGYEAIGRLEKNRAFRIPDR